MIRDVELFPVLPVVRAPVGATLCPDIHDLGIIGVRGNGPDRGRLGKTMSQKLPPVIPKSQTIQAGFDHTAWGSLTRQTHIHIRCTVGCHSSFLPAGVLKSLGPAMCCTST